MNYELKQTLFATVAEVFETMFFSYLDMVEDAGLLPNQQQDLYMKASIGISGKEDEVVCFYFPESLARQITVNFLGVSADELSEDKIADVLGETANMTIGSLLGKLDPQSVCAGLSIPTVQNVMGLTVADIISKPNIIAFSSQHGPLLLDYGVLEGCLAK